MGVLRTGATKLMQDSAAGKEKRHVRRGTQRGIDAVQSGFDEASPYLNPYVDSGLSALSQLEDPLENFYASPDYEFRRSEGLRDINNQFAARGGGGNAMRALVDYSSNIAGSEFGNWFNRLFARSQAGQNAAGAMAGMRTNLGENIANLHTGKATALSAIERNRNTNINNAYQSGHDTARELVGKYLGSMGGFGG